MGELSDFETEHISSGDLFFNCGTQLLLKKGTSRTRPSCPHPFLWPMKSLSNTLGLEFLMVADIKRPFHVMEIKVLLSKCSSVFLIFFQVCAIVGGTFTVAGILDSMIFTASELFKKAQLGKLS